jgi:hypothetical protein
MIDINNLYVDLDLVLNKRAKLGDLLNPSELNKFKLLAEKNHWDDDTIVANIHRYLKTNISDFLDNSDFIDAQVIVEKDFHIIKAMELMDMSQKHAEVLLVDRELKYPGSWVNEIAQALKGLVCEDHQFIVLMWDAYYMRNWDINSKIPGWTHLATVLDNYYDTL